MAVGIQLATFLILSAPAGDLAERPAEPDPAPVVETTALAQEAADDFYDEGGEVEAKERKPRRSTPEPDRSGAYDTGFKRGQQLGETASNGFLWFCLGFICSPMFFPFGCLLLNGYACLGGVDSPVPDSRMSPEEAEGFMDGYEDEVSSSRTTGALIGTGLAAGGAAAAVTLGLVVVGGVAVLGVVASGL